MKDSTMFDSILGDFGDAAERETLRETWNRLEELEPAEPSPELARRFARTIEFSRAGAPGSSSLRRRLLPLAAVLVVGIAIGGLVVRLPFAFLGGGAGAPAKAAQVDPDRLSRAVAVVFEPRPLASRRLEAVETLAGLARDPAIGRILSEVVSSDPSIGVRLGAIDAIEPYVADEEVARRLVQAVRQTDSTLVRIRLIELFVDHRIAAARPEIDALDRDPRVDELVRETVRWAGDRL